MTVALNDLRLDALYVVYPGGMPYVIDDRIAAVPAGVRLWMADTRRPWPTQSCRGKTGSLKLVD